MNKVLLTAADLAIYASIVAFAVATGLKEGVGLIVLVLGFTAVALSTFSVISVVKSWLAGRPYDIVADTGSLASMVAIIISVLMVPISVGVYAALTFAVAMYAFAHSIMTLCHVSKEGCHLLLNPSHFHQGCVGLSVSYERYLKMKEEMHT